MTRFLDGPAKGQVLLLKRAPKFLRVVEAQGKWDALDQLNDFPKEDEKVFVYIIEGEPVRVHLNRGKNGSGWFMVANYKLAPNQPDDAVPRLYHPWHDWCVSEDAKMHPEKYES